MEILTRPNTGENQKIPTTSVISDVTRIAAIRGGHCSNCQADLSEIIDQYRRGELSGKSHVRCPECQAALTLNRVTILAKLCGNCKEPLHDANQLFCAHCAHPLQRPIQSVK